MFLRMTGLSPAFETVSGGFMTQRRLIKMLVIGGSLLLACSLTLGSALAQQFEINPYAGGFLPGTWGDAGNIKKDGIYGVRGGVYLMDFVQLDGTFGYINHFKFKNTPDPATRAYLWDVNGSLSLRGYNIPYVKKTAEPFVTLGLGGLSTGVHDSSGANFQAAPIKDGDTFLTFNYGGGFKAVRLWGPFGLRADFRGRTLPNFYGHSLTWFEPTGGINFMWGER